MNRLRHLSATVSTALEEKKYRQQRQAVHFFGHSLTPANRALLIAHSRRLLSNALRDNDPNPELSDARIIALALLQLHRHHRCTHEETVNRFFDCLFDNDRVIQELFDRVIADPPVSDVLPPELLTDLQFAVLRWGGLRGVLVIPITFHQNVNQEALTVPLTAVGIRTLKRCDEH